MAVVAPAQTWGLGGKEAPKPVGVHQVGALRMAAVGRVGQAGWGDP